jgi:hypothetical protein
VTAPWDSITDEERARVLEEEIKTAHDFRVMMRLGSSYSRHTSDKVSAMHILSTILDLDTTTMSKVQQETQNRQLESNETSTGLTLNKLLLEYTNIRNHLPATTRLLDSEDPRSGEHRAEDWQ